MASNDAGMSLDRARQRIEGLPHYSSTKLKHFRECRSWHVYYLHPVFSARSIFNKSVEILAFTQFLNYLFRRRGNELKFLQERGHAVHLHHTIVGDGVTPYLNLNFSFSDLREFDQFIHTLYAMSLRRRATIKSHHFLCPAYSVSYCAHCSGHSLVRIILSQFPGCKD